AAVVGATDELTGQTPVAFVILRTDQIANAGSDENINNVLRNHVAKEIGPIAKPKKIMVVPELPKTRSGKIMRRLLRDVAEQREIGDTTTLADVGVMGLIASKVVDNVSDPVTNVITWQREIDGAGGNAVSRFFKKLFGR
ncbi:MAG: hypothetical protein RJA35_1360, partial [Actinomycetota bacterium]